MRRARRLHVGFKDLIPTASYWLDPTVKRASRFFVLPWIAVYTLYVAAPFVNWVMQLGLPAWVEGALAMVGGTLLYLGGLGLAEAGFKQIARGRMVRSVASSSSTCSEDPAGLQATRRGSRQRLDEALVREADRAPVEEP